jgi:sugar/nucleoside kinase (ribokinase family)
MTHGIFVGLSTIDIVYNVDEFPAANCKVAARSQDLFAGGPATNASIAFAHLGGQPTLVAALGRHPLAAVIREDLARYAVQFIDLHPDFDGAPALSSVAVDRNGNRNVVSANAVRIPAPPAVVDQELCARASILMADGHSMQACQAWAKAARALGTPVVLDGGSWKPGTEELLKHVDTAICSADFLPPGCSGQDDAIRYLQRAGVRQIAITQGAGPVRYLSGAASGSMPVPRVQSVDTTGAGDIFHGAYCYFAALGRGFVEALEEAARIAANSCRFHGTREWMKSQ